MVLPTPSSVSISYPESIEEIETPAVIVDLETMERNVNEYVQIANEHDVRLRSHAKTHKIPELAHYQHQETDSGIVCQTLSEAEVMAQNGIDDIYLTYMVVDDRKLARLVRLSQKLESFATTVDCEGNINPLQAVAKEQSERIDVALEIDAGLNRVGTTHEQAVEMARYIDNQSALNLIGVMAYEGHVFGRDDVQTPSDYETECLAIMDEVARTVDRIEAAGIAIDEVKVGSTATSRYSCRHPIVTEINPGMYIFNDANLVRNSPDVTKEDCALSVLTTVISKPTADRVIVDAGSKTIAFDTGQDPMPVATDTHYYNASEEHGWVDISGSQSNISVGDRLEFIPPHVCTTVNLHDTIVGVKDSEIREIWNVQARGKIR